MDQLITNATTSILLSLGLVLAALISVIQITNQYSELQHLSESLAVQIARSAFTSHPRNCQDLKAPPAAQISACEIGPSSVFIRLDQAVQALGKTWRISAESQVGYGFYSQNGP